MNNSENTKIGGIFILRVIGGLAKGLRLKTPSGDTTRPTTDRVKESLFNIITPLIMDAEVLDLFAGSGSLGIEALSRGAGFAVFADTSKESIKIINENINYTKFKDKSLVLFKKDDNALRMMFLEKRKFDIIFLDPPYSRGLLQKALLDIAEKEILSDNGIIVAERFKDDMLPEKFKDIKLFREQKYGETVLSFYGRNSNS